MRTDPTRIATALLPAAAVGAALGLAFPLLRPHYLLFHSGIELAAATTSLAMFLFAWNTRRYQNAFLLVVGMTAAFVGLFEVLHCLAFPGMQVFRGQDTNLAPQLWLSARLFQATAMIAGLALAGRRVPAGRVLALGGAAFVALCTAVFLGTAPDAVVPEGGLTAFKIAAEWVLTLAFATALVGLARSAERLGPHVRWYLTANAAAMVGCEVCFTLYSQPTDPSNYAGHVLLACATVWQYQAIVRTGLVDPNEAQFRELSSANRESERVRALLAASEERFRVAIGHSPVSVYTNDRDLRYTWVYNPMAGFTAEQMLGRRDEHLWPPVAAAPLTALKHRVLETGRGERCRVALPAPDGTRHYDVTAEPVREGGAVVGLTVAALDITEIMRADEALREADRRKDDFLATLSHELRNPLAPIRNSLHVLERAPPGGGQALRAQAILGRQVGQIARLVDDLLDVTRVSRGKLRLQVQRLDLSELARRTLEDHRWLFEDGGIVVVQEAPVPVFVRGDSERLGQVLGNLLQNAAKFTPPGGRVRVGVEEADGRAVLRVADTGAGIAADALAELFRPFFQSDRTLDRSPGGLGLGLALVRGLVSLHEGEVEARSDGPGRGTEFTVRLPACGPEPEPAVPPRPESTARPRRVLVVDDNADTAESLREALELGGHEVSVALDGAQALERARALRPEVVLCDIGLPGMSGYEVAGAIRAEEALRGTFLVALTGRAMPEDLRRAKEAGFDRHLVKPPALDRIEELLRAAPGGEAAGAPAREAS